jgi:hypothetical protein
LHRVAGVDRIGVIRDARRDVVNRVADPRQVPDQGNPRYREETDRTCTTSRVRPEVSLRRSR